MLVGFHVDLADERRLDERDRGELAGLRVGEVLVDPHDVTGRVVADVLEEQALDRGLRVVHLPAHVRGVELLEDALQSRSS